jgi:opine dehydrogenase
MATLPYGARVSGGASARIALVAEHLPTGVYPAEATDAVLDLVRAAYPAAYPVEDALSSGLLNFDGALHGPLVCMNAGAIEGLPTFDIHVQGASPAVVAVSCALDDERIALRRALGYTSRDWPLRDYYDRRDTFYGVRAFQETRSKSVWNEKLDFGHRYVVEDIGCGLALWSSLGRELGVPTPLSDALLAMVAPITGEDYRRTGRTLENLGLAGLRASELRARMTTRAAAG